MDVTSKTKKRPVFNDFQHIDPGKAKRYNWEGGGQEQNKIKMMIHNDSEGYNDYDY